MAKTIKFNLICDNNPVRTLEDLQNHFSIEDVLDYYNNKLLYRWLDVRGYKEERDKVSAITSEKSIEIIKQLIEIFHVAVNEEKVEEDIYIIQYLEQKKELCHRYAIESDAIKKMITDYKFVYEQLIEQIIYNPNDLAKIKAVIKRIAFDYSWIFELDHRRLFYLFKQKSVLAVMCLLMNESTRKYYLPIEVKDPDGNTKMDIDSNHDKAMMFKALCNMLNTSDLRNDLGEHLLEASGITDGRWKDLEPRGKKCMILEVGDGDLVRPSGETGKELGKPQISNKFVILDGIDYKSDSNAHVLRYMEV